MSPPSELSVVKPTNEARQGVTGHNVRWVQGLGILGVVVVFAGLWLSWLG
jgi:hypothetical protein